LYAAHCKVPLVLIHHHQIPAGTTGAAWDLNCYDSGNMSISALKLSPCVSAEITVINAGVNHPSRQCAKSKLERSPILSSPKVLMCIEACHRAEGVFTAEKFRKSTGPRHLAPIDLPFIPHKEVSLNML
jgi:Ni,Fe-hydrogenase III small subunit